MSEKTERLANVYLNLAQSEGGKHLLAWIEKTATEKRKNASKSEPAIAYGDLRFADGLDEVANHIKTVGTMASNTVSKAT